MVDTTRRSVLTAGAVLASGGMTALSGCTEDLENFEGSLRGDGDESSRSGFSQWLYAPDAVGNGAYTYTYVDVEAVEDHSEFNTINTPEAERLVQRLLTGEVDGIADALAITYPETGASGTAAWGELDLSTVRSDLDDATQENDSLQTATHRTFELYFDGRSAVAVPADDSSILLAGGEDGTARDIIEAMIDARNGTADRLAATDDDADALLGAQTDGAVAYGTTNPTEDNARMFERTGDDGSTIVSGGYAVVLDGESPLRRLVVVTDAPVEDAAAFGETLSAVGQGSNPTYARDGRVVTVEVDVGTAQDADQRDDTPPQATFDFEHDLDAGTARVTHAGGDSIDPSNLELRYETDNPRTASWADRTGDQVTAGTSVRFPLTDADQGGELVVLWSDGDRTFQVSGDGVPERTDGDGGDGGSGSEAPQVSMDADFDFDRGTVTVTHAGGDSVPTDELDIAFLGDETRVIHWNDVSDQSSASAGDAVTVDLLESDYGGKLILGWRPETQELDSVRIPEP